MKWPSPSVSTMKPRAAHTLTTDRRQSSNACDMVISRCVANDHGAGPVGARGRLADVNAPSLISNASVIARPSAIITATAARTQVSGMGGTLRCVGTQPTCGATGFLAATLNRTGSAPRIRGSRLQPSTVQFGALIANRRAGWAARIACTIIESRPQPTGYCCIDRGWHSHLD